MVVPIRLLQDNIALDVRGLTRTDFCHSVASKATLVAHCSTSVLPPEKLRTTSVRKRPGRPADNRPAFSPARPGQCETDLGFVGQALGKPAGFMGAWRRRQAFGIFHVTSEYFVDVWVISTDI